MHVPFVWVFFNPALIRHGNLRQFPNNYILYIGCKWKSRALKFDQKRTSGISLAIDCVWFNDVIDHNSVSAVIFTWRNIHITDGSRKPLFRLILLFPEVAGEIIQRLSIVDISYCPGIMNIFTCQSPRFDFRNWDAVEVTRVSTSVLHLGNKFR